MEELASVLDSFSHDSHTRAQESEGAREQGEGGAGAVGREEMVGGEERACREGEGEGGGRANAVAGESGKERRKRDSWMDRGGHGYERRAPFESNSNSNAWMCSDKAKSVLDKDKVASSKAAIAQQLLNFFALLHHQGLCPSAPPPRSQSLAMPHLPLSLRLSSLSVSLLSLSLVSL